MTQKLNHVMSQKIRRGYRLGQEDETLPPHVLVDNGHKPVGRIKPYDGVIFFNIRGEREIELTRSLTENDFAEFPVVRNLNLSFATMIEYKKGLPVYPAFPPDGEVKDTLSEVLSRQGKKQLKITESEKAFHVGYFFNGKRESVFPGEDRIVVPSRKDVKLFDEAPEMSIYELTHRIVEALLTNKYNFILANLPNVDVVGHVERESSVIAAIEAVDRACGLILDVARQAGYTVIVTADHGSAERWLYPDGKVDTGHSDSPVPFILVHPKKPALKDAGDLTDVSPTVLHLMGLPKPAAMTGNSLLYENLREPVPKLLLLLLDGWGYREEKSGNLIARAHTPNFDMAWLTYPHAVLEASGLAVGLPAKTVGNSEAGHIHLGAGRRVNSDRVKIDLAIADGSFFQNEAFAEVIGAVKKKNTALHLLGIVSFFSSHGSIDHLFALMELARREKLPEVYIHAMLGRRGELPESGALYLEKVENRAAELQTGELVSVIGRYWSLDREENWDRVERAYRMLVFGEGEPVVRGE